VKTNTCFWSYLAQSLSDWEMLQINVVEKINTHFKVNNFFLKLCCLCDRVEKYCTAGQAIEDDMVHARCMQDNQRCKHTLRACNTYWFCSVTTVARTRLNVTLYGHRESSDILIKSKPSAQWIPAILFTEVRWIPLCTGCSPYFVTLLVQASIKIFNLLVHPLTSRL
jgi:hypothetical protein